MLTYRCAWKGCTATCADPASLPAGWIAIATFRGTRVAGLLDFANDRVYRDAVLCPDHAAALEAFLISLPQEGHDEHQA